MMLRKNSVLMAAFASLVASGVLLTGQQPAGGAVHRGAGRRRPGRVPGQLRGCHGEISGHPAAGGRRIHR